MVYLKTDSRIYYFEPFQSHTIYGQFNKDNDYPAICGAAKAETADVGGDEK